MVRINQSCPQCGVPRRHDEEPSQSEHNSPVHAAPDPLLLTQLVEATTEGIITVDLSGLITFANNTAKRLLGSDDLVGRRYDDPRWRLLTPEDDSVSKKSHPVSQVHRTATPLAGVEYRLKRHDGSSIWLSLNAIPLFDGTGTLTGIGVALQDVSDRRQRECALLRSESTLESILNSGRQSIIVIGCDRRIQRFNTSAAHGANAIFGMPIQHGDSIYRFVNPEDVPSFDQHVNAALQGEMVRTEVCLHGIDGRAVWYEIQYNPVYDPAYAVSAICLTVTKVDDRKRAEARLHFLSEASATLASSLDYQTTLSTVARLALPDLADHCMVSIVANDGSVARLAIAHVDPAKEAIAQEIERKYPLRTQRGYGVASVLESKASSFVPNFDLDEHFPHAQSPEHRQMLRSVGYRSYICVPMIARDRILGTISLFRTESETRFTEHDLELAEELGARAAFAIDNARLYREMEMSVHLREEFLSIASHELKTPLTTVKGYVQLLNRYHQQDRGDSERATATRAQLLGQVERFEELIDELLDLSRIQGGRLELRPEWCDLASVAREVFERFHDVGERTAAHELRFEAPAPVYGAWDASRMDQVITNLLSNALKYSPHGGAVTLRVERQGIQAHISVQDEGIGIPLSDQALLFQPFSRGVFARGIASGVGLGLHITAQIVDRHGGSIDVTSEPGVGSVFTVRLPLEPPV